MAGTASMLSIGTYGAYSDDEETEHHSSGGEDDNSKLDEDVESKNKSQNSVGNNSNSNNNSNNNNNTASFSTTGEDDSESRLGTESAIDNISDEESSRAELASHLPRVSAAPPVDREANTKTEDDKDQKIMKAKSK